MSETIKDGTGTGKLAGVTIDNQLKTLASSSGTDVAANNAGNAYNINSGIINLTDALETSILYIKNNETLDIFISAIVVGLWNSANGDGLDVVTTFIRNPTTGDIIDNTNAAPIISNRNFGSSNSLSADVYIGASTETKTNGSSHILARVTEESRSFFSINEFIPKGASFGVNITPPTGNDGMNVYAAVICHLHS